MAKFDENIAGVTKIAECQNDTRDKRRIDAKPKRLKINLQITLTETICSKLSPRLRHLLIRGGSLHYRDERRPRGIVTDIYLAYANENGRT